MKHILEEARKYESLNKEKTDAARPYFHFSPLTGWCNDPNGFSLFQGEYHLFYQYYPYDVSWGLMHWGHAKTKDFIKWEYLPAALASDEDYDESGCFSGSAIDLGKGKQLLIYTGCHNGELTKTTGRLYQQQCLAIGDGINYEKVPQNPVIPDSLIPDGYSKIDFRDPKIWKEEDGYYLVVAGFIEEENLGAILLYHSQDGFDWEFVTEIDRSEEKYGSIWECPDLFKVDQKQVLVVSPPDIKGDESEFFDGYGVIGIIGDFDKEKKKFKRQNLQNLDFGTDFYAPQTLESIDNRRILIAWMQNWQNKEYKMTGQSFFGEMCFPRQLHIKENRIYQTPVEEIKNYYTKSVYFHDLSIKEPISFEEIKGSCLDLSLTVSFPDHPNDFEILLRKNGDSSFIVHYNSQKEKFQIDRSQVVDITDSKQNTRFIPAKVKNKQLKLRVLMDRYSIEMFVNDGEYAASFLVHTEGEEICFSAAKTTKMTIEVHEITRNANI